ncbi:HAD family hydrolase [Streptomonospora nanhaiensis]|uniref:Putative hydrolase of the HAD superfamily n=1 Tax=Streptomonospora nanhaiensis TaxID=1323731 RepID=A0A853BKT2_9ACTN|nr:HAD family phosphatase [Streptomonospora nanhaiensis]MBX9391687.1 HAD family phosphatase [Streptomonospora nanhaiensis]NYI95267.1 putative hydrolase of the HAD superfamily [Streptomonospora nanhaiensis]
MTIEPTTIKAVWTDFGGVLTPPVEHTFAAFCAKTGLPPEPLMRAVFAVTARYGTDDMMLPLDTPLVTEQEWLGEVAQVLRDSDGIDASLVSLADTWFDDRETNEVWLEELHALRARGVFVGMLSNMPPAWDAHWRRMVPPESVFDDVVMSFEVGRRKPGKDMFDLAAERAGVRPEECLLVDDLAKNCEGAVAAGWQAIRFAGTGAAVAELRRLMAPAPAAG